MATSAASFPAGSTLIPHSSVHDSHHSEHAHNEPRAERASPWTLGWSIVGVVASIGASVFGALAYSNGWLDPVISFGASVVGAVGAFASAGPIQVVALILGGILVVSAVVFVVKIGVEALRKHLAARAEQHPPHHSHVGSQHPSRTQTDKIQDIRESQTDHRENSKTGLI